MSPEQLMAIAFFAPLLSGALALFFDEAPDARETIGFAAAAAMIAAAAAALASASLGATSVVRWLTLDSGLYFSFRLEPLGALFALALGLVHLAFKAHAAGIVRAERDRDQTRFFAGADLAAAAAVALAYAGDLMTMATAYSLLALALYALLTLRADQGARMAGRLFAAAIALPAQGLLMIAWVWTWRLAGSAEFSGAPLLAEAPVQTVNVLALLFGVGLSLAGVAPMAVWLLAMARAPSVAAGFIQVLGALAGAAALTRIAAFAFGPGVIGTGVWGATLAALGGIGSLIAALAALGGRDLRARAAAAHASGVCLSAAIAFAASPFGLQAAALSAIATALAGSAAFICAGAVETALGRRPTAELTSLGRRMPAIAVAFAIAALSLANLPPGGGAAARIGVIRAAGDAHNLFLLGVAAATSVLILLAFAPVAARAMLPPRDAAPPPPFRRPRGAHPLSILAAMGAGAACIVMLFYAGDIGDLIRAGAETRRAVAASPAARPVAPPAPQSLGAPS